MTPLRKRFIEDMQLRGLAPTTQRSYIHYTVEFAKFFKLSPDKLDLLPEQIAEIAFFNKEVVYGILFRAVSETLLTIAADPQHLGAAIGFFAVPHTPSL